MAKSKKKSNAEKMDDLIMDVMPGADVVSDEEAKSFEVDLNFEEEAKLLKQSEGGLQLQNIEELYDVLKRLLMNSDERQKLSQSAEKTVKANMIQDYIYVSKHVRK